MHTNDGDNMNIKLLLIFALFPFLHQVSYDAELISCEPNEIILKSEDSTFQVEMFNVLLEENAWPQICGSLKNATEIQFEIDPSSAMGNPLPVYLFADHYLLQEDLIRKDLGTLKIANPEYTYTKKLQEAKAETQVMADNEEEVQPKKYSKGWLKLAGLLFVWGIVYYGFIHNRRKKHGDVSN